MNNSKAFDDVINYLEKISKSESEVDYNEISKLAMCPSALFQRIFSFVAGVSISEYVRKRRLTLAAQELHNSDITVLEVAVKYGFQSHSSFCRAFREQHNITPSQAKRTEAVFNNYLPITFSNIRLLGGKQILAELKKIIYKETDERIMVGMRRETSFMECGEVWQAYFKSKEFELVCSLPDEVRQCDDIDDNEGIGCSYDFVDDMHFTVLIGDFVKVGTIIPDGLATKYLPKGITAHIQIEGNCLEDIIPSAYLLITEAIEKTGRQIDYEHFYWCDVYTCERYCEPMRRGEKVILDYILPVK